jgi:uncharacterized SAM-binding protein YcdF (DUF218 family)
MALGTLEWQYPPLTERPDDVQAIVVLSSYVRPPLPDHPQPQMDEESLYRCIRAAEVYHTGRRCPVVVSGGGTTVSNSCAQVMRDFLVQLAVDPADVIVEGDSSTTNENALESAKLLRDMNIHKIALVTTTDHLPRAVRCFRKQGFDVVPCGCHYSAVKPDSWLVQFIPSPQAARTNQMVCHEWLGLAWYWLHDRI